MTKIEPAFIVATQNADGSRNFIRAFVGDTKDHLEKAVATAIENGEASVWACKTGQRRYDDNMVTMHDHMFDATEMTEFAIELVWHKGELCGRFELDPRYA
jgi:hypothetical protein